MSMPGEILQELDPAASEPHTSAILQRLIREAPEDYFTLQWLISHLPARSFGVILLFLALISILPVISIPARLLILVLIGQIILGYPAPALPQKLLLRRLPSKHLRHLERRAIPSLERLEMVLRPRWRYPLMISRRFVALIAMLLTLLSLLSPLPFSNVPPAIISIMIALAYIEHDGLMLTAALIAALATLALAFGLLLEPFL